MPRPPLSVIYLKKAYRFAFSPSGSQLAYIGGRDVTVLDLGTRKPLFAVHPIANPSQIDFSPDGRRLLVKGTSGRTIVLDATNGQLLCDFRNQKEGEGDEAFFSACGRYVVSVSWRGMFSVRNSETSEMVFVQSYTGCQLTSLSTTADRRLFIYSVGGAPRSPMGLTPCTVCLHRWPNPSATAEELPKEWTAISGLQVSPSGRFLALIYGTPPVTLEIYDLKRLRAVAQCHWSGSPGCSIAWSRDEKTLLVKGKDCFLVYALPGLKVVREVPVEYPCFVRFSPGEDYIGVGSWKKSFVIPTECLDEFEKTRKRRA